MKYVETFLEALREYTRYLWTDITEPSFHSYFYALIGISLVVYALELVFPWRKNQARIREDFWLDAFYMFFNFFLFALLGYHAIASTIEAVFVDARTAIGLESLVAADISAWPSWLQLLVMFVVRDFIHYWIHRLLHRVPFLWKSHKIHHSVRQMGFAAHLRYHWVETVVYRSLEYIPLGLLGFGVQEFFAVHIVAIVIGHLNHANIRLPIGPLRYVFNSPQMHIWHHAKELPTRWGANFGLSLSVWDWRVDCERIDRAGSLFFRSGIAGGITLGAKSLIAGYCSPAGNKPLVFSGQLESRLEHRLAETGKFVVATNTRGALWPGCEAWSITLRVRLMHAKVRSLIERSARWNDEWGVPINQHDMVATSLLFSSVFLDGIRAFGVSVSKREAEDYMHLWRYSGWLMGVREDLLPATEAAAHEMMSLIELTQGPPDEDARALARALLESPRRTMTDPRRAEFHVSLGSGMCRALLGDELADGLDLPRDRWRFVVPAVRWARRMVPGLPDGVREALGKRYWKRNVEMGLGGAPASFHLPIRLARTA